MTEFDSIANMLATHSIQLAINLVRPFRRQRARLDGRAATIRRLVAEVERLEAAFARLPRGDDIDLAMRANNMGGLEFKEDYCECDSSVGMCPCPYCAIDSVLRRLWRTTNPEAADAAKGAGE